MSTHVRTLLQIAWMTTSTVETSWEPALNLPVELVEDYERGTETEVEEMFTSGGQTVATLSTHRQDSSSVTQPQRKRAKRDDDGQGYI